MSRIVLFDPTMSLSATSKQRKIFSFSKLGRLDEKRAVATSWLINSAKILLD